MAAANIVKKEPGRDPAVKLKDMFRYMPSKGRALFEMTVQNILYDRKTLIFFGLSLLLLIIPGYWAYTWNEKSISGIGLFVIVMLMVYLQFIVLYACLLFGASLFAEEEEQKTITYLTSRPLSTFELVLYKYLGFIVSVFLMFLVPILLTFAIIASHTSYSVTTDYLFELGQFVGLVFVAIMAWGAFFMFLGALLRKTALMAGLLYALFWETFVANIPTSIKYGTVNHYIRSLAPYSQSATTPGAYTDWGPALGAMIGFTIVCLLLTWYFQRKLDYN